MRRFSSFLAEVRPTLALAVPIIVGQVSQMLMGITDSVMIGQTGTVPLAASSFGGNVFGVFYVIGIGLMIPVAVFVARARGAARLQDCGEYLRHGLALALGFGVLETLAMVALGWQLHWFQQPPEVLAVVNPFFWLIGASITPVAMPAARARSRAPASARSEATKVITPEVAAGPAKWSISACRLDPPPEASTEIRACDVMAPKLLHFRRRLQGRAAADHGQRDRHGV